MEETLALGQGGGPPLLDPGCNNGIGTERGDDEESRVGEKIF